MKITSRFWRFTMQRHFLDETERMAWQSSVLVVVQLRLLGLAADRSVHPDDDMKKIIRYEAPRRT